MWVLTGDKKQTAINIGEYNYIWNTIIHVQSYYNMCILLSGLSCNQLTPETKQLVITEPSLQVRMLLQASLLYVFVCACACACVCVCVQSRVGQYCNIIATMQY